MQETENARIGYPLFPLLPPVERDAKFPDLKDVEPTGDDVWPGVSHPEHSIPMYILSRQPRVSALVPVARSKTSNVCATSAVVLHVRLQLSCSKICCAWFSRPNPLA